MPEFQPVRFGKYLLLEKLATGGMAQLYRAKITGIEGFEKLIAIKMILPHLGKEKELISAFIDEAKLAALLNHQNIVQIYDFGNVEDTYFISMEYLFGNDLRAIWNKAREKSLPLSLEYALFVISRVCSGLAYAHELKDFQGRSLNIIHRDISPQNIFVTYQGDVKILDFGIAKAASQSTVTQYGMIKGKVAYMSPEQAAGKPVDQRSDIFSTGILLYELITNAKMFNGESTIQILTKVRDAEYRSPRSIVGGLHAKVYGILDRALAKEPDQRYQTCSEMLADLEECIIELGLRPSARGLAQYMKALFETEMAAEDQVMREIGGSRKIEIVEFEKGQERIGVSADEMIWDGSAWRFERGEIRFAQPDGGSSRLLVRGGRTDYKPLLPKPREISSAATDPANMTWGEFRSFIARRTRAGEDVRRYLVELYSRLAIPFACLAVAMVGAPLGVQTRRSGTAMSFGLAILVLFAYFFLLSFAQVLGRIGVFPPAVAAWLANVILGLIGIVLFRHRMR